MQATAAANVRQAGGEFIAKNSATARTLTDTVSLLIMVFHQFICKYLSRHNHSCPREHHTPRCGVERKVKRLGS